MYSSGGEAETDWLIGGAAEVEWLSRGAAGAGEVCGARAGGDREVIGDRSRGGT